jgi:TP901 family phage tail tape measure protein
MAIAELNVNVTAGTANFVRGMSNVSKTLQKTGRDMEMAGKSLLQLTAPLTALGAVGVRSFAKFDNAMTQSLAIMGDVSSTMRNEMVKAADEVARSTTFSSEQAAQSYFFLASAGLDAQQSIAALPQVARFAQAGMFDMARATDLATDAQSALGLTVSDAGQNLENLTRITDVLVKANTLANASVEQFADAITNRAGAALKNAGKDIEEGVAVLAAFADQGVKGREAGTALAIVMRDLQTQFRKNTDEFKKAGVAVFDAEGNFNNLGQVVSQLENKLEGMSAQQRNATLAQLGFTDKSIAFIQTLLGQGDAIQRYEKELRSAAGATEEVANKQLQSFTSQMTLLRNEMDIASRSIGEALIPTIEKVSNFIRDAVRAFQDLSPETKQLIVNIGLLTVAFSGTLFVMGKILTTVAMVIKLFVSLNPVILGITAVVAAGTLTWITYGDEIQEALTKATKYWEEFTSTLKSEFPVISQLLLDYQELNRSVIDQLKAWYADYFDFLIGTLGKVGNSFKSFIGTVYEGFQSVYPEAGKVADSFVNIKKRVDESTESTKKQEAAVKDLVERMGGVDNVKQKWEGLKTSVVDAGLALIGVKRKTADAVQEVTKETKKSSVAFEEMGKEAKKGADEAKKAIEGLQKKWDDLNRDLKEKELKKAIEEAVKAGNEAELKPLLEALRQHTKDGILEGMKDATKDGGKEAQALAEKIAQTQSDAIIEEEQKRTSKAILESRKKIAKESATLWERLTGQAGEESAGKWGVALGNASREGATVFGYEMSQSMAMAMQGLSSIANYIKDGIFNGFKSENFVALGRELGGSIGQAAGTAIAGPIGGAIGDIVGSVWGDKLAKNLSGITKGGKDTAKALYTIMTMDPITGELLRPVFNSIFKGTTNIATLARREFERQFNEMIDGKNIRIFDENGILREVDKISVGAKDRFNGNWADSFHQLTGDASSAFLGVGYALQNLMGITEDVGGQIAHILATELGGSMQNLALLLMGLDIPIQDMEAAMVEAFMNGSISAHDFSVFMQGITQGYAEMEAAQKDFGLAVQLWLGSGGEGQAAVNSFRAVMTAAAHEGITSVEQMVQRAIADGLLTAQQGEQLLRAFAAHGITSMSQLENATDAMIIHILGSLETMEKEGENSFFGVAEKINENFDDIEKRWERIRRLPTAVLNLEFKIDGYKLPSQIEDEMRPLQGKSTKITIPALAEGGIVSAPTLAMIGEGGEPEIVSPLSKLPELLKSLRVGDGMNSAPSMSETINNISIDARGAMRGVGDEIDRKLRDFFDKKNGALGIA